MTALDVGLAQLSFKVLIIKDIIPWMLIIIAYLNHERGDYALHVFVKMLRLKLIRMDDCVYDIQ